MSNEAASLAHKPPDAPITKGQQHRSDAADPCGQRATVKPHIMAALTNDDDASTRTEESLEEESDLDLGQDYIPPPPLPPWPRGAAVKATRPPRHRALDKLGLGHALTSFEVVRALLGNDLLRAVPTDIKRTMEYSGAEIRVVGLLWRGGGDEVSDDDEDPLKPDEWLPREVLAYPPLLELPREQIMRCLLYTSPSPRDRG